MTLSTYEPPALEIWLTRTLGATVLSPYYRGFVRRLGLRGDERVIDYGSGSGVLSRHIAARLEESGGRLVLREPQDEGLMPNELRRLADTAGLEVRTLGARKLAFGAVYDASFTRKN